MKAASWFFQFGLKSLYTAALRHVLFAIGFSGRSRRFQPIDINLLGGTVVIRRKFTSVLVRRVKSDHFGAGQEHPFHQLEGQESFSGSKDSQNGRVVGNKLMDVDSN